MTVQLNKAASFFAKQDVTIEMLSFLDPRSMARAFAACKDFQGVKHEVFAVFLRTYPGLVPLNECVQLSTLSLKKVTDWGSLCNRMEGRFAVEMDLCRCERSIAEQRFKSVLTSNNIAQVRALSAHDQLKTAASLEPHPIIGNPELLALTKAAPHLQHLELVRSGVTPEGLGCLQNLKLETLSFRNCSKITDHVASALAGMTCLTELGLPACKHVTERGLGMLLQTLKNLRKVNISNAGDLFYPKIARNHQMVQALTDHGKQLTHVTMDTLSCDFAKVEAMVKSCTNLVFLSHVYHLFSSKEARMLQGINPNLTLRIMKSEASQYYSDLLSTEGHPRTQVDYRLLPDVVWEIMKPLPRETTVEEYANIMLRYSGPRTSFRHVWGDWKFHGENSNRCLLFAATTESLIDNFKLRGSPDGTISAWIGFNPNIFKSHLVDLGLKVVSQFDSAFKITTKDELRQAIEILFRISEMPEPYLSQIGAIVKGSNS